MQKWLIMRSWQFFENLSFYLLEVFSPKRKSPEDTYRFLELEHQKQMDIKFDDLTTNFDDLYKIRWSYNEFCSQMCFGTQVFESKNSSIFRWKILFKEKYISNTWVRKNVENKNGLIKGILWNDTRHRDYRFRCIYWIRNTLSILQSFWIWRVKSKH